MSSEYEILQNHTFFFSPWLSQRKKGGKNQRRKYFLSCKTWRGNYSYNAPDAQTKPERKAAQNNTEIPPLYNVSQGMVLRAKLIFPNKYYIPFHSVMVNLVVLLIQIFPNIFFKFHCLELKILLHSLVMVDTVYFLSCKLFCWERIAAWFVLNHEKESNEIAV